MKTVFHPVTCPYCEDHLPLATDAVDDNPAEPENGDWTICFHCGRVAVFDDDMPGGLRKPNAQEDYEFKRDPIIRGLRAAWQRVKNETR